MAVQMTTEKQNLEKGYGMKTTVWIFWATNTQDYRREDEDIAEKGNYKRETASLLISTQSNVIRTNYILAKIDNKQHNS